MTYVLGGGLIAWIGFLAFASVALPDRPRGPTDVGILIGVSLGLGIVFVAVVMHG